MVYEDLSIDFGRRNKHPKSRYGVQTRLRALLEPAMKARTGKHTYKLFKLRKETIGYERDKLR